MAQILYCRHPDCHEPYPSEAGKRPEICPKCLRKALWTTTPPNTVPMLRYDEPRHPYELHENDRRLLHQLRICADD